MRRRKRGIPGKVPVLELQCRDLDLLECLGRLGPLGSDLLAAQFWHDAASDPARRRLRKLTDLRAVAVTLVGARSANLYCLTRTGLSLLVGARGELDGVRIHEPVRAARGVAHGQLVAAFRLYLSSLSAAGHGELLAWHGGRSEVAATLGLKAAHIAPDGIADVALGRGAGVVFAEADTGSEGLELRAKLGRYADFWHADPAVKSQLWIAASGGPARLATVAKWAAETGLSSRTRILPAAMLLERPALAPQPRLDRLGAGNGTERGVP